MLKFPSTLSEESESKKRSALVEGHPVIHKSAVLGAPPEMFQAGIVKNRHEVVLESPVKNCGIRRLDRVIQALESKNLPVEKDHVLWLLQGTPQYRVFPHAAGEKDGPIKFFLEAC